MWRLLLRRGKIAIMIWNGISSEKKSKGRKTHYAIYITVDKTIFIKHDHFSQLTEGTARKMEQRKIHYKKHFMIQLVIITNVVQTVCRLLKLDKGTVEYENAIGNVMKYCNSLAGTQSV